MQQQPLTSAAQTPIDLSVRVIPFAVGGDGLEVGLLWNTLQSRTIYLPTGCPRHAESLTDCANRVAIDALATTPDYLEQLYTFSVNGSPLEVIVAYSAILSADTRARVPSYADVRFEHADDRGPPKR